MHAVSTPALLRWARIFIAYFGFTLAIRSFFEGFTFTAITVSCEQESIERSLNTRAR